MLFINQLENTCFLSDEVREIANKLCISLSTVITHRKNITEKLKRKSVGALTVYAVMQGYIDIEEIDKLSD